MDRPDLLDEADQHLDPQVAAGYDAAVSERFSPDSIDPAVAVLSELAGDGISVEFAVGTGRIALPLGDMTETWVCSDASLAYLVFNTIGNLRSQQQQVACFRNAAAHLRRDGRFVIENGIPRLRQLPLGESTAHVSVWRKP